MTDKLTDLIDQMVETKTFSLDALTAIKALKDKAQSQEAQIERLNALSDRQCQVVEDGVTENSKLRAMISAHFEREADLLKREAKVLDLQLAEARAVATAAALRESFGIVFKNTTVRESIQRSTAVPTSIGPQGQFAHPVTMPESSVIDRTAE